MAVANYHDTHGHYPPAHVLGPDGKPWHSWRVLILPFIEEEALFKEYRFDEPWYGPNNRKLADRMPRTYRFPNKRDSGDPVTNYLAVVGDDTAWPGSRKLDLKDIKDERSTTILFVENDGAGIHWMEPRDLPADDLRLDHPDGISSPHESLGVAMHDCSLRSLRPTLSARVLGAMLTIAGGEKLAKSGDGWEIMEDGRDRPLK